MGPVDEQQLELFPLEEQRIPPPRRETVGRLLIQLRYDHVTLATIGCLVGVAIIFACGVERGKQLARFERALLARQEPSLPSASVTPTVKSATANKIVQAAPPVRRVSGAKPALVGVSRYAIQVVTYSRPHLAHQELLRLQTRGERAFLIKRDGRTAVYVGPFPSQSHASQKLTTLKTRYQDCFVKTL